ncbi:MAG: endolytic transglycosylase MltG [Gemmatimonadales bacterium]
MVGLPAIETIVSRLSSLASRLTITLLLASCSPTGPLERVAIPPGTSVRAAADSLSIHGVIWSRPWFRLRARWAHVDQHLKAGIYQFARHSGTSTVLRALRTGNALRFRVTVPLGGTLFDLARAAQERLGIPRDSLVAAARDSELLQRFGIPGPSVEGWLLPESFDFGGFDTARDVLVRFITAREQAWDSTWDARAASAGFNRSELLTLASIVEAEALDPAERPLIAAVYRNRLRLKMPLQADPTIEYAYLLRNGVRKGRLYNGDYQLDSPWNTYRHPGLPPGPVGNPSRQAIEAVLAPAKVPYLYFVAGPDGKSFFATTSAQHLRNIARVRRE